MPAVVYRLIAPRDTFSVDMTEAERATLAEHGRYWTRLMEDGKAVAFGPVHDPAGSYGLGILIADDIAGAEALRDAANRRVRGNLRRGVRSRSARWSRPS